MERKTIYALLLISGCLTATYSTVIQAQEEEISVSMLGEDEPINEEMSSSGSGVKKPVMPVVQVEMLTPAQMASQMPTVSQEMGENPRIYQETDYPVKSCPLQQQTENQD